MRWVGKEKFADFNILCHSIVEKGLNPSRLRGVESLLELVVGTRSPATAS